LGRLFEDLQANDEKTKQQILAERYGEQMKDNVSINEMLFVDEGKSFKDFLDETDDSLLHEDDE